MDKEMEKKIFGYIDPYPPVQGSCKDDIFRLVASAEPTEELNQWLDSKNGKSFSWTEFCEQFF